MSAKVRDTFKGYLNCFCTKVSDYKLETVSISFISILGTGRETDRVRRSIMKLKIMRIAAEEKKRFGEESEESQSSSTTLLENN